MPSPMYDNAWLAARNRPKKDQTRDIMHTQEEQDRRRALAAGPYEDELSGDPLAEAQAYLENAPDYSDIASIPDRLTELQSGYRPSLAGLTGSLANAGQMATAASLPAAFVPGGQGVAAGLGIGGTLAQVPDMLRRGLNDDPSDDPGELEGGLALLGLVPGMGRLGKAGKNMVRRGVSDANRPLGPSRFESATEALDSPNFQRAAASNVPSRASNIDRISSYDDVAEQVGRGAGAPDPANLSRTRTFGDLRERIGAPSNLNRTRTFGDLMERIKPAQTPKTPSADWMQTVKDQGRTIPYSEAGRNRGAAAGLPDNGEDAWSALRTLATRSEGKGNVMQPTGSIDDMVWGSQGGPSVDLSDELSGLSGLDRASRQARAQQRFGRVYRSE